MIKEARNKNQRFSRFFPLLRTYIFNEFDITENDFFYKNQQHSTGTQLTFYGTIDEIK